MKLEKKRIVSYWIDTCTICNEDFEITEDSLDAICPKCYVKKMKDKARKQLNLLVDTKITSVVTEFDGYLTELNKITSVEINMDNNKQIKFSTDVSGELYIEIQ